MSAWTQKATKRGDGDFEKPPPGNHPAVCVAIIDMGTQENNFNGNVTKQRRAFFVWELVTEKMSGTKDRNHVIGIDLTVSLNEKAKLRQWVEARAGKQIPEGQEYDISKELGKPCLLTVTEKNGYPKVSGMSAVPKGLTVPPAQNKPFIWSLDDCEDPQAVAFPDWIPWLYGEPLIDHVRRCAELDGGGKVPAGVEASEPGEGGPSDSDIPF